MRTAIPNNIAASPLFDDAGLVRIFTLLGGDNVRLVGGPVRDALLGHVPHDVDLATSHLPGEATALLEAGGVKVIPTGIDHGTITAVIDSTPYQITTLRRDVETDGRHAVVAFGADWAEDAARRDFTINALYADSQGRVFDPLGQGLDDLANRRVRFIGDAAARIKEDALRILRFFRFSARFADAWDEEGLAACHQHRALVDGLSAERVRDELLAILALSDPAMALHHMKLSGILHQVTGSANQFDRLEQLITLENRLNSVEPLRRLFLATGTSSHEALPERLRLSRAQTARFEMIRRAGWRKRDFVGDDRSLRRHLYKFGREGALDAVLLTGIKCDIDQDDIVDYAHRLDEFDVPVSPVRGADLRAVGYPDGPALGTELKRLEDIWLAHGCEMGRDEVLALIEDPSS